MRGKDIPNAVEGEFEIGGECRNGRNELSIQPFCHARGQRICLLGIARLFQAAPADQHEPDVALDGV